jgi:uncharacterized OB-fold protein
MGQSWSTFAVSETIDTVNTLEYPYTRTTGPYMGPFLTALRDGKLIANKIDGRTFCPPLEYDPNTGATAPAEFVEVGPGGTVVGWTWIAEPSEKHPFTHPFAFALIKIDGTDVPMVHAVDAGSIDEMATLMRVSAQYRDERHGAITDVYFVPLAKAQTQTIAPGEGTVEITEHLISLKVREQLYPHRRRFANGLLDGKIIGQKSPVSGKVYVPGRGYDNLERVPLTEADEVVVADKGTVVAFTVITPVQYYGQKETEPYIRCSILLDNSDQPIMGVDVRHIPLDEFRVGMRLGAEWKKPNERSVAGLDNRGGVWDQVIDRWMPTGEPDVDFEKFKEHTW